MDQLLSRLQRWYSSQCNGEWEHQSGISIDTLDNPGWIVKINLSGTGLDDKPFVPMRHGVHDDQRVDDDLDWYSRSVTQKTFEGAGDPFKLAFILQTFLDWAESFPEAAG
jgi:hypothetical protein